MIKDLGCPFSWNLWMFIWQRLNMTKNWIWKHQNYVATPPKTILKTKTNLIITFIFILAHRFLYEASFLKLAWSLNSNITWFYIKVYKNYINHITNLKTASFTVKSQCFHPEWNLIYPLALRLYNASGLQYCQVFLKLWRIGQIFTPKTAWKHFVFNEKKWCCTSAA